MGVVPYTQVDIDEEDSLSRRFDRRCARKLLDVAVIRLPRISNFTDFSPFERYENVSVRYVDCVGDLGRPDLILLPGTKSTLADLAWLRQSGLEAALLRAAEAGTLLMGICGGYQMLGSQIEDPEQVEACGITRMKGMGLLEMETVFAPEKVQRQTSGTFSGVTGVLEPLNGLRYEGYEIHMGRSREERPAINGGGNVYGSYIHGLFDAPGVADAVLRAVCLRQGIDPEGLGAFDMTQYRQQQYDLLARTVRQGLDMERIYRILKREE